MTALRAAETAFRWLMLAYPPRFRRAHGLALFELFRDEARDACGARGWRGVAGALAHAAADTAAAAPATWLDAARQPETAAAARRRGVRLDVAGWRQDVALACRQLGQAPAFTAIAVATLAIGVGATVTIFSVINAVLLRPLALRDPSRVVRIVMRFGSGTPGTAARRFSFAEFADYRSRATTIESLSAVNLATFVLAADGRSDQIVGEIVSASYLDLVGASAIQGRLIADGDDGRGAEPVAMISEALWRRRFGGEAVVGRPVLLNNRGYTVIGVVAANFGGSFIGAPVDIWVPIASSGSALGAGWEVDRTRRTVMLLGRLRADVGAPQARSELQAIATAVSAQFAPDLHPRIEVVPGTLATGDQRRLAGMFLTMLLGLVAVVLVLASANVANLMLARVLGRRRELAIRTSLGASPWRLARMLMVESLVLSAAAGAAATVLSLWTSRAFADIAPLPTLRLRLDVHPDWRVTAFTVATVLATAAMLAIVGSLQAIRPNLAPALHERSVASGGRGPARLRAAMAALQVAASLLLVVGAGLFVRSVEQASAIELGFDPRGVVVLDVDAGGGQADAASAAFFADLLRGLALQQDVRAAAVSTRAPLDSSTPLLRVNAHQQVPAADDPASPTVSLLVVSPAYFDVVRTPIVAGRGFAERDDDRRPRVAIVNQTLAAKLWPNGTAVGRRLWLDAPFAGMPFEVIGIARDSKYLTLGEQRQPHVYVPFAQQPRRSMAVLVRSTATPDRAIDAVQRTLRDIDPHVQGFFARTLVDHVAVSTLPVRLAARVTTVIAAIALALAVLGLYSLVSFLVGERTHELGVRIALGAGSGDVLRLVAGYGLRLALAGVAVGVPIALAGSRLIGGLLYGVSATDPAVFAWGATTVVLVSVVASYLPARRALRVDPVAALKSP
jgi:putative ABC transport system permease protein